MSSKKKSARSARVTVIGALGLVLAGLGAVILIASRESSSEIAQQPAFDAPRSYDAPPAEVAAAPTAKSAPVVRKAKAPVAASIAPAVSALPVKRPATAEVAAAPKAPAAESASRAVASESGPAPITITGCLERSDTSYRLTETTGLDAPKSRSWKKGFLKKGMAPVGVVDSANRLNLSNHVGQRVSVTGLLVDREMTLRSLQRISTTCD